SGRSSSTRYTVTTATGRVPPDVSNAPVVLIRRAFNSLIAAQERSADVSHLATTDLMNSDLELHWACYGDGPDVIVSQLTIQGWTTAPGRDLQIFTPTLPSQVGANQRHEGVWNEGRYAIRGAFNNGYDDVIVIES